MQYKLYYSDVLLPSLLEKYTSFNTIDKYYYAFSGDTRDIIFKDDGMIEYNSIKHRNGSNYYGRSFSFWNYYVIMLENNEIYIIKNTTIDTEKKLKEFKTFVANVDKKVDEYVNLDAIIF